MRGETSVSSTRDVQNNFSDYISFHSRIFIKQKKMSVLIYIAMQIVDKTENYANAWHINFIPTNIIYIQMHTHRKKIDFFFFLLCTDS